MAKSKGGRITPKGTKNYPKARHAKTVRKTSEALVRIPLDLILDDLPHAIAQAAKQGQHG